MRLKYYISILCATFAVNAAAQHPFSTKWYSIKTPHVKIIADEEINQQDVYRIVNSIDKVFACDTVTLKDTPRRIPLVMSNTSMTSNGYVTLFPYKMYWYGLPFQDNTLGIGEWYQNLAVHEYRHVVQYQSINHGFTKFVGIMTGAFGRSGMRYSIPNWWFEGDAVYAETMLTSGGRGRTSSFDLLTASILTSRSKPYPYDKLVNGSYRNKIPNHYELGYPLVTHGRKIAGADVWTKTARRSSWYSFWPWAFGSSFRHYSGVNLTNNYKQTMSELRSFYDKRIDSLSITDAKIITKKHPRRYTSYNNPLYINDTTIVAIKSSLTEPNKMVTVTLSGKEEDLFYTEASAIDYADGKIVWATAVPDVRWTLRGYSDIAIYDFATKKRYRLTRKGRYFSPAISPEAKYLAAVEFDPSRNASLVIFKAEYIDGHISSLHKIKQIPAEFGEYLRGVTFVSETEIAAVSNYKNKNAVVIYDVISSQRRVVKDYDEEVINTLKPFNGNILYDSEYSGISNIWLLNIESQQCAMLTSRRYSASEPDVSPDGHTFIYSDFSATGANIVSAPLNINNVLSIDNVKPCKLEYFKPLIESEPYKQLDYVANAPTDNEKRFAVKKYRQYHDLIRCYGWMPYSSSEEYGGVVYSENTLETFRVSLEQIYRTAADYWRTTVAATYSGFYPVLGVSASFKTDADKYYFRDRHGQIYSQYLNWDSKIVNISVSVPFNLSRFNWSQSLNLSSQFSRYMISNKLTDSYIDMGNGDFNVLHGGFTYSLYRRTAYRDFHTTLGFSVLLDAMKAIESPRKAQKFKSLVSFTMPGFFRQNSLTIDAGYMRQVRDNNPNTIYLFTDTDFEVRGYSSVRAHETSKLSGEYAFPLGYPDWGIPAIAWVKRVRGSLFADAASSLLFGYRYDFASAGCKLLFDVNFLRIPNTVSVGFMFAKPLIDNIYSSQKFGLLFSYQL